MHKKYVSFFRRIKLDFFDYREKLGIGFKDEEKFKMLSNILQSYIDHELKNKYSNESFFNYCTMTGENYRQYEYDGGSYNHKLLKSLEKSTSTIELISKYIAFCNSLYAFEKVLYGNQAMDFLKKALDNLKIVYEVIEDEDGVFIFPKGAKELDDALVSQPLEWLKEYPKSQKSFIDALKSYSEATEDNASNVADLFRKALEAFCQEFFKIDKSLEKSISDYCSYLEQKGVPKEISNNFNKLLDLFSKYNNNYAKHHDKSSLKVLEFIMYQTGNLIRLPITLSREDCNNAD